MNTEPITYAGGIKKDNYYTFINADALGNLSSLSVRESDLSEIDLHSQKEPSFKSANSENIENPNNEQEKKSCCISCFSCFRSEN